MPGMVGRLRRRAARRRGDPPRGVKVCGVMADLVPPAEIARITRLLGAPYANTFGATETGCPPCSSSLIPIGVAPTRLSKQQSPFCEVRLVDADDVDVPDGTPGELVHARPDAVQRLLARAEANAQRLPRRLVPHGRRVRAQPRRHARLRRSREVPHQVRRRERLPGRDRARACSQDPRVADVRRRARAGREVGRGAGRVRRAPRRRRSTPPDDSPRAAARELAGYKQPKEIVFIAVDEFPRSASGKVQRHELEKRRDPAEIRRCAT